MLSLSLSTIGVVAVIAVAALAMYMGLLYGDYRRAKVQPAPMLEFWVVDLRGRGRVTIKAPNIHDAARQARTLAEVNPWFVTVADEGWRDKRLGPIRSYDVVEVGPSAWVTFQVDTGDQ